MQTSFPTATGYAGQFIVSYRKNPANTNQIQPVGTAVLKRSYAISPNADPAQGVLTPTAAQPVFMQDQPVNLVSNGDFTSATAGVPNTWHPDAGVVISQVADPDDGANPVMHVQGAANGRVTQTLTAPLRIGSRRFWLSFRARADSAATATVIQLEAGGQVICNLNCNLTTSWQHFSVGGIWPAGLAGGQLQVVLSMATDSARTVLYDDVAVAMLHYEHDLAAYKPAGDLVVLAFNALGAATLTVNGQLRLSRVVLAGEADLFGWQLRDAEPRESEGGFTGATFPLAAPLPPSFQNRYCNGFLRSALQGASAPFLPSAARVLINRTATLYGFTLGAETISATYTYYPGSGPDEECSWRRQPVAMNLDTLVIEPESNRCYAVWRGVWNFAEQDPGNYRRLIVAASE